MVRFLNEGNPQGYRDMAAAEEVRVRQIIERDKREAVAERDRKAAELEVAGGKVSLLPETAIEPTPEWLAKGDTETFIPKQAKGTTVLIKTRRRIDKPIIMRMWKDGRLTDDQMKACLWYRDVFEIAGLDGSFKTSQIGNSEGVSGGGAAYSGHIPNTLHAVYARQSIRGAREAIGSFYLKFFEAVVCDGTPIPRAARFAKCRREKALFRFRQLASILYDHLNATGLDLSGIGKD